MYKLIGITITLILGSLYPPMVATAGTVAPIQSTASPYGLEPVDSVQLSGSDEDAADFNENTLEDVQTIVNETLTERQDLGDVSTIALDPSQLVLTEASTVRIYFISEGAGYQNSLGVYTGDSSDGLNGDAALIFPNASTSGYVTQSTPLSAGDFVDLGPFESGTQLNLFLIANGANGGEQTYYTDMSLNGDGIDHFVVMAVPDSPYLLVGVEDLYGGGDKDYNDIVFVMDIGSTNAQQLISNAVPLPGPVVALMAPLLLAFFAKVKGSPYTGHRRHINQFTHALDGVGLKRV